MEISRCSGNPTPEEAAAVIAAIEQFLRDTAPAPAREPALNPWKRAALAEALARQPDPPAPWT